MAMAFGQELLIDLYKCKPGLAADLGFNYQFLIDLVDALQLTKQSPPFLFVSPAEFPDKAGLSGWVPLIESGIQIHTLTVKNFISLDVYTCNETINVNGIIRFCEQSFLPERVSMKHVMRGEEYYED